MSYKDEIKEAWLKENGLVTKATAAKMLEVSKYFNQKSDLTFSPSINVRRVYDKIAYERALTDTISLLLTKKLNY